MTQKQKYVENFKTQTVPETPYQKGFEEWDDRIGSARKAAKGWRIAFFLTQLFAFTLVGGIVYIAGQSKVIPYIVEIDRSTGETRVVGRASDTYSPTTIVLKHFVSRFILNIRTIPTDPQILQKSTLDAYNFVTDRGKQLLNAYYQKNDPFQLIGTKAVTAEIDNITKVTPTTFQVQWRETEYTQNGTPMETPNIYSGMFTFKRYRPPNEAVLLRNPIGIFFDDFNWSKQLTAEK